MSQLTDLNIAEARDGLSKGDFTSTELTQAYIKSMEAFRSLNAYSTETPEIALERAKDSDARRASGSAASPAAIGGQLNEHMTQPSNNAQTFASDKPFEHGTGRGTSSDTFQNPPG